MQKEGFTLIELTIAMGIAVVVAVLGFAALQSSTRSMRMSNAMTTTQANVRNVLAAMIRELELAASEDDAPLVYAVATPTEEKDEIVFQVPLDASGSNWSTPIIYRFVNEDENGDGRLDEGEDENGDGALTRRIVRIQDGEERPVGAANDLSFAQFELDASGSMLTVRLTSTKRFTAGGGVRSAESTISSRIQILN